VNTTADERTPADGLCSLREAIEAVDTPGAFSDCAASAFGADTIVLGPHRYALTIPRAGGDDATTGDLNLAGTVSDLTVTGAGAGATVIDATGLGDRVLQLAPGAVATMSGLTLTGGHAPDGAPGAASSFERTPGEEGGAGGFGGAVENEGTLTLVGVSVTNSSAGAGGPGGTGGSSGFEEKQAGAGGAGGEGGGGGAIFNSGKLTLTDVTISGNSAGAGGLGGRGGSGFLGGDGGRGGDGGAGAGVEDAFAEATISGTTISANAAGAGGAGGTGAPGFQGGHGGEGGRGGFAGGFSGGLDLAALSNSTIVANEPGDGGPGGGGGGETSLNGGHGGNGGEGGHGGGLWLFTSSMSSVSSLTIVGNRGSSGGAAGPGGAGALKGLEGAPGAPGTAAGFDSVGGEVLLRNTLVASNATSNCATEMALADGGHNLSFGDATCPVSFATGDPKLGPLGDHGGPTQTIGLGAGSAAIDQGPTLAGGCPPVDQRGVARPFGPACDIGAYEVSAPHVSTGPATGVGTAGATIAATVTANAADATVHFEIGTTTAYGMQTAEQHVGGVAPAAVSAGVGGLAPATTYHYRVLASSGDGSASGADATFTTAPTGRAGIALLTELGETFSTFALGKAPTPSRGAAAAARRHHKGTVFHFKLDQRATVTIAIQSSAPGRRVGGRCRPDSPRLRHKRACARTVTIGKLIREGHAGSNSVPFTGRIGARPLKPGRYRALFTAVDAAGPSAPQSLRFTVVRN
jgi:CSLREA domain-containing protein